VRQQHPDAIDIAAGGPLIIMADTKATGQCRCSKLLPTTEAGWPDGIFLIIHATPLRHDVATQVPCAEGGPKRTASVAH
jgi:uncharacterized protein YodC (DUF2158 family)